jgi:5-methylthioadenosine/S-adenosylhomocysteine deaminase
MQGRTSFYDMILYDATVLTMNKTQPIIENATVGIQGNRITLLTASEKLTHPAEAKRKIHLQGRIITPGYINVHTHAILTMVRGVAEDLGFAPAYTPGVPHGHDLNPEQAVALARLGGLEAMLFGSTLVNDTYVHADVTIGAMADLGLRVFSCSRIHDVDFSKVGDGTWEYDNTIGDKTLDAALKLAEEWHGKENGRIGVQFTPHAPDTCSAKLLRRVFEASRRLNLRVNTHLCQSQIEVERIKERDTMSPVELLEETGVLNDHLTAAHCIFLSEEDIKRIGRAGITVAHIPKGNATGGTMAKTGALRRSGANLALGTDNMHADMTEVMRWALAIGRIQEGRVSDFWQPQHVFRMATLAGAKAMGLENEIGSIEVGKKADLVVFDFRRPHHTPCLNPLGNLVHTAQGRDVEFVIIDGRIVVEDSRPTLADEEEICQKAAEVSAQLWDRARKTL